MTNESGPWWEGHCCGRPAAGINGWSHMGDETSWAIRSCISEAWVVPYGRVVLIGRCAFVGASSPLEDIWAH